MTESNISNEAASVTVLPAPSSLSTSYDSANDEVNISWTKTDDSSDGSYTVERSEDGGSSWTNVTTITDLSVTSATDTAPPVGSLNYRVLRSTAHTSVTSNTAETTIPTWTILIDGQKATGLLDGEDITILVDGNRTPP